MLMASLVAELNFSEAGCFAFEAKLPKVECSPGYSTSQHCLWEHCLWAVDSTVTQL